MKILSSILFLSVFFGSGAFAQIHTDTLYFDTDGIDAFVNSGSSTTNYGTDTSLQVYYDYGSPTKNYYTYLQIDFDSLPANAVIVKAELNLYAKSVNNAATHIVQVNRVTSSWTETGITFATVPSATSVGGIELSDAQTSSTGWHTAEITAQVQYNIANPASNFGYRLMLKDRTGTTDKGVTYASSEDPTTSIRPHLVVQYYIPMVDTIYLDTNGRDAFVNSGATTTNYGVDSTLRVYWDHDSTGSRADRTYVQSDLSGVPQTSTVISASLNMYAISVNNAASHPMYVHGVTKDWNEDSIKWSNMPSTTSTYSVSVSHASTSSTGWQSMPVKSLVQQAVWLDAKNFGWRVALQSEAGTVDNGVVYASAEHDSVNWRPYIIVEYEAPIEVSGYVTHATSAGNDGSIEVSVTGGCYSYTNYIWKKFNNGSITTIEAGSSMATSSVSGLSDGLYLFEVTDYRGATGYRYFFVGKEGATTTVSFNNAGARYTEDSFLTYYKSPVDSNSTGGIATSVSCHFNPTYDSRSVVQYQVDWDPTLEFISARQALRNKGACYRTSTSYNDAWVSRVTGNWEEDYVTWSSRPSVTTADAVYIPSTTTVGYENRNDTINIVDFIPVWQQYPDSSFGFELALADYSQPYGAHRDYSSSDYIGHNLIVSFTVKPKVEVVYYDSLGTGDITVNAPAAELPYTYLIGNVDTIPVLDSLWLKLKNLAPIDSSRFFSGKSNTRNFTYPNLSVDRYFLAVYDNNGTKIMDGVAYVKPSLKLKDSTDIIISGDTISVDTSASAAKAIYYGEVSNEEAGGIEVELTQLSAEIIFGFNKWTDSPIVLDRDFEYGLLIKTNGTAILYKGGIGLDTFAVAIGDQLRMINEHGEINIYKNGVLESYVAIDVTHRNTWKMEVNLKGPGGAALLKPYGKITPKGTYTLTHPTCAGAPGILVINPANYFGYALSNYSLVNVQTSTTFASGSIASTPVTINNIPTGVYNLVTTWSTGTSSLPLVVTRLAIGPIVQWTDQVNITQVPMTLNTIKATVPSASVPATANSINNTDAQNSYWIQFEPVFSKLFSEGVFEVKNLTGDVEMSIHFYQYFGVKGVIINSNSGAEILEPGLPYTLGYDLAGNPIGVVIPASGPFLIQNNAGTMSVNFQNNQLVEYNATETGIVRVSVQEYGKFAVANTIASFCVYTAPGVYVTPKRVLEGGFYLVPLDDILHFEFQEEYTGSGNLNYTVKDYTGQAVPGLAVLNENFGDNRIDLNVSALTAGYYVLEIRNDKNEVWYLRFKVQ